MIRFFHFHFNTNPIYKHWGDYFILIHLTVAKIQKGNGFLYPPLLIFIKTYVLIDNFLLFIQNVPKLQSAVYEQLLKEDVTNNKLSWYGIVTGSSPRITTKNAPNGQIETLKGTVLNNCLTGILTTGGSKAAGRRS